MPVRQNPVRLAMLCLLLTFSNSWSQRPPADDSTAATPTREQLLASPRWQQLLRSFDTWLSVQEIYSKAEAEELKQGLKQRIETMSAGELSDFMDDTEERLTVLLSNEAADARAYLKYFTVDARKRKLSELSDETNVFDMTVGQLREELSQFQQQRATRAANQAALMRSQARQAAKVGARRGTVTRRTATGRPRHHDQAMHMRSASPYRPQRRQQYKRSSVFVTPWGGIGMRFPGGPPM